MNSLAQFKDHLLLVLSLLAIVQSTIALEARALPHETRTLQRLEYGQTYRRVFHAGLNQTCVAAVIE